MVRIVYGTNSQWYERSMGRMVHGTNGLHVVRKVRGTNSQWKKSPDTGNARRSKSNTGKPETFTHYHIQRLTKT